MNKPIDLTPWSPMPVGIVVTDSDSYSFSVHSRFVLGFRYSSPLRASLRAEYRIATLTRPRLTRAFHRHATKQAQRGDAPWRSYLARVLVKQGTIRALSGHSEQGLRPEAEGTSAKRTFLKCRILFFIILFC